MHSLHVHSEPITIRLKPKSIGSYERVKVGESRLCSHAREGCKIFTIILKSASCERILKPHILGTRA